MMILVICIHVWGGGVHLCNNRPSAQFTVQQYSVICRTLNNTQMRLDGFITANSFLSCLHVHTPADGAVPPRLQVNSNTRAVFLRVLVKLKNVKLRHQGANQRQDNTVHS